LAFREVSELKNKLAREKLYLEDEIRSDMNFEEIVGNSPALKGVLQLVETVAPTIQRFCCSAKREREKS
jgi:formate hydrogenlyase transcriptional activator